MADPLPVYAGEVFGFDAFSADRDDPLPAGLTVRAHLKRKAGADDPTDADDVVATFDTGFVAGDSRYRFQMPTARSAQLPSGEYAVDAVLVDADGNPTWTKPPVRFAVTRPITEKPA